MHAQSKQKGWNTWKNNETREGGQGGSREKKISINMCKNHKKTVKTQKVGRRPENGPLPPPYPSPIMTLQLHKF